MSNEHEHEAEQLRVKSGDSREHMRQDSMTCRRAFLQHVSFTVINTSDCRDRGPCDLMRRIDIALYMRATCLSCCTVKAVLTLLHAKKAVVVPGLAGGAGAPAALLPLLPG